MNKFIKKRMLLVLMFVLVVSLVGCSESEKTFSGAGTSITLNESFVEKEVIQAPLYLESQDHIFMSMRETKDELSPYGIFTLKEYIDAVLLNSSKDAETFSKGDEPLYMHAYYESTVNDQKFGYMLLVFESEEYFIL